MVVPPLSQLCNLGASNYTAEQTPHTHTEGAPDLFGTRHEYIGSKFSNTCVDSGTHVVSSTGQRGTIDIWVFELMRDKRHVDESV